MNILIPACGLGSRFQKDGYSDPKPLIKIFDKPMIEYVLDSIYPYFDDKDDNIFIIHNNMFDQSKIKLKKRVYFILLKEQTSGAVETLYFGLQYIFAHFPMNEYNKKTLILDCDTFYTHNIINMFRKLENNVVFYRKNYSENPIYSYILLQENDTNLKLVFDIVEKEKISDNANTGAYGFCDINILYKYCFYVLENNITFNGEPYTSCVIKEMIKNENCFYGIEIPQDSVISLGTPFDVQKYIDETYVFLFDLDGTLVITDKIYYSVWTDILNKYNISLTPSIFSKYIQGHSDKFVSETLLPLVTADDISQTKDDGFINNIDKLKIMDGMIDFLQLLYSKGHKCSIITNCNKNVANAIIKHIGIEHLIDFLISADDCKNPKPSPDPYLKAISNYNTINNKKCFIFEDSKTGILSAKSVNPKCLIGIETLYSHKELINYGADLTYKNFVILSTDLNSLLLFSQNNIENIKKMIRNNVNLDIIDIFIDETKLKGGFICDVIKIDITTNDNIIHHCVLKYENKSVTGLSIMAKNLELYQREYYFYEHISKYVNVKIPKFIGLLKDYDYTNTGILLENLLIEPHFKLNLDLNSENINISLKIVDRMAKMHSKFWGKDLQKQFPQIKKANDKTFCPFLSTFIQERIEQYRIKWKGIFDEKDLALCSLLSENFQQIQNHLSESKHLTLVHGDIKSPNIIYDSNNDYEPYFLDWQHMIFGLGVNDLIFFIIESFNVADIDLLFPLFTNYYYRKITEYHVHNYSFEEYNHDIMHAVCYTPFFTSCWFSTVPTDELIDKNFPYFFTQKFLHLLKIVKNNLNTIRN